MAIVITTASGKHYATDEYEILIKPRHVTESKDLRHIDRNGSLAKEDFRHVDTLYECKKGYAVTRFYGDKVESIKFEHA